MKLWRLTLECGHLRISGPWDDDEHDKHMIGDITWCGVCPLVRDDGTQRSVMRLRQVVNVEDIPSGRYRQPDERADRGRHDQGHG